MKRTECLKAILGASTKDTLFAVALGKTCTIWADIYKGDGCFSPHAMGYVTPFGLGLSTALPGRRVVVIDGDGSIYLNLGVLTTIGAYKPKNLVVVIIDNEMYEMVGKHPTPSAKASDLEAIAKGCGIDKATTTTDIRAFNEAMKRAMTADGPNFIDAKVQAEEVNLPYPTMDGRENKYRFVRHIERTEGIKILGPPQNTD